MIIKKIWLQVATLQLWLYDYQSHFTFQFYCPKNELSNYDDKNNISCTILIYILYIIF